MPVRVLDGCTGNGTIYDVMQGIRYSAGLSNDAGRLPARRADVINLSLGAPVACDSATANLMAEVRAQGVVVVAAAGNDDTSTPASPASCPNVISVAAVGPTAERAPYSNYGSSWVDVAAPGGDMRRDSNGDGRPDGIMSTHASGGGANRFATYELLQGTSMASPHVAGVVALMKSEKPSLTPAEVDALLAQGLLTHDIGAAGRDDLGVGLISAFKAVQAVGATPPSLPASLTLTPSALNFGDVGTLAQVVAANGGTDSLVVSGTTTSDTWLRVEADDVDANGLGRYVISVARAGLPAGSYSGWVEFASSAGAKRVSVLMQVASSVGTPDAGWQYVLLVDPLGGDTLEQVEVRAIEASAPYRFDSIAAGDYVVVAGTDMNNDGFVCDDGEACGAYPVESSPSIVSVAGERLGIDFSTAFRASVQTSTASLQSRSTAGFARRQ
jgi:serine protease